ncbi:MAG: hypothetical protein K8T91_08895 [Planctomycetes bacterium]|nr:hypothetical protein [Planctomycetota bacterium]
MAMAEVTKPDVGPPQPIPGWQVALRILWIAVQLLAVFLLAQKGEPFFYQGF